MLLTFIIRAQHFTLSCILNLWMCVWCMALHKRGIFLSFLHDLGNTWNTFMCNFYVSGKMHLGNLRPASVNILLEISMPFSIVHKDHIRPRISFFFYDRFKDLCTLSFLYKIKIPIQSQEVFRAPWRPFAFLYSAFVPSQKGNSLGGGEIPETPFSPISNILLTVFDS